MVLHGYGDEPGPLGEAVEPLLPADRAMLVPRGPVTGPGSPAWFPSAPGDHGPSLADTLDALAALCADTCEAHGLDPGTVTVLGYSQGAATALALALRAGARWRPAAAIGVAAWLPNEPGVEWDLEAAARQELAVLLVHGADDDVVDPAQGRAAARVLDRHGVLVTWHEHAGDHRLEPALPTVAAWFAS